MNGSSSIFLRALQRRPVWLAVAAGGGCSAAAMIKQNERQLQKTSYGAVVTSCDAALAATTNTSAPATVSIRDNNSPSGSSSNVSSSSSSSQDSGDIDENYPNFSRHGNKAVLPRILTPELYKQMKDEKTPLFGVTLEDMIPAGVSLPWGANPPRGIGGVYAGDPDCYKTFAPVLLPLVEMYHGVDLMMASSKGGGRGHHHSYGGVVGGGASSSYQRGRFVNKGRQRRRTSKIRRHLTNLDPEQILDTEIDPSGEYILYTRMRLARNIDGYAFCSMINRGDRRQIQQLFQDIVNKDFRPLHGGAYVPIHGMSNFQHEAYMNRRMCFLDPDEYKIAAKLGRDWPDGRGIYCTNHWNPIPSNIPFQKLAMPPEEATEIRGWEEDQPNIMMWCNYDDHFWIISVNKGGDVQGVFTCLSDAVRSLELALLERNKHFVMDPKLGFLTSSPSNVGTALRASMSVKLVRLGKEQPELFQEILHRLHLEAKSDYAETDQRYTGIFDIANAARLGRTEVQYINLMIVGIAKLIELEKKLERGETVTLQDVDDVVKNVHHDS